MAGLPLGQECPVRHWLPGGWGVVWPAGQNQPTSQSPAGAGALGEGQ